jgi:hypothetical protein
MGWALLAKKNEVAELDQVLEKMNAEEKDSLKRPGDQRHDSDAPNLWNFLLRTTTN